MSEIIDYGNQILLYKNVVPNPQSVIEAVMSLESNLAVRPLMTELHEWNQAGQFRGYKVDIEYPEGTNYDIFTADSLIKDSIVLPIIDSVKSVIENFSSLFDIKERPNIIKRFQIREYRDGAGLGNHIDAGPGLDYRYSLVVYLNDSFSGGDIYFPEQDTTLKPSAGAIAIFPSTYEHGVNATSDGTKWHLPLFWDYSSNKVMH